MSRSIFALLHARYGHKDGGVSRRQFLKAGALASAALLLSGPRAARASGEGKRIIVVGAGFAGLACAYELMSVGYNVTIIEARRRVSGRVLTFSDWVGQKCVEGGGEFIGTNHPLWQAYTKKFDLTLNEIVEDEENHAPIMLDGKILSDEDAEKLYKEMEDATGTMNDDARAVVEDEPWKTPGANRLDHMTVATWLEKLDASPHCKAALNLQFVADNGVPLDKQSYLGMLTQVKGGGVEHYWTDSETQRLNGGNQKLAERFAEVIGADHIVLGAAVEAIDVAPHGVNVSTRDRRFDADDVVLTVPPSVVGKIKINPGLPKELSPQMGKSVKYLAKVGEQFWRDAKLTPDSLSDGALTMTWEGTDGQKDPGAFVFSGFASAANAEICRKGWASKKEGFFKAEIGKIYKGFDKSVQDSRFMDWPTDPLTMAAYSFPAPGQVTKMGPLMLKPHAEHLHFAGEHTCYKFVGYMEGGLQSGVRAARRLAERDGLVFKGPPMEVPTTEPAAATTEPMK